jgi:hypothetical protein
VEYEKDAEYAAYGLTESVGYLRGILRMSWFFKSKYLSKSSFLVSLLQFSNMANTLWVI